jgi:glycosyltransferase involved in cell wall biosynthesis
MRIAIFNWRCFRHPQSGGAELYLHKQAMVWADAGHEVTWLTSRPAGIARKEEVDGIQFVRRGGRLSLYIGAAFEYFRLVRKADVIIDVENGIPFFTPLYARVPVVLLIFHVHTDVWKREESWLMARLGSWLEQKAMPMVYRRNLIVTISESSSKMIKQLFPARDTEIKIVYSGVAQELVPGKKAECPEIIYLGRLRRYKSIDVLLNAVSTLADLSPTLHLVGQGDDESRLKKLADSLGLQKVVFHGHLDEDKKRELLQRSWVAVNPSSMEGWGITNIEANACGTPVIGADVPGIRDSISVGKSGLLVPYGDVEALSLQLRNLIKDQNRRMELGSSAVEWAKNYSWEASALSFAEILKSVCGN